MKLTISNISKIVGLTGPHWEVPNFKVIKAQDFMHTYLFQIEKGNIIYTCHIYKTTQSDMPCLSIGLSESMVWDVCYCDIILWSDLKTPTKLLTLFILKITEYENNHQKSV